MRRHLGKELAVNAYNTSAVLQSSPRLPRPSKRLAAGLAVILSLCAAGSVSARPAMPLLAAAEVPAHVGPAYAFVNREPAEFGEIWAYLMAGEERFLVADAPITDLAYFSARISSKGELYGAPDIQKLSAVKARKHLVVAEVSNQALIHFVLNPAYPLRNKLIKDIAAAAKPYDGVNIDFESMRTAELGRANV